MFNAGNQINEAISAAKTPSVGAKPSAQLMQDTLDSAVGHISKNQSVSMNMPGGAQPGGVTGSVKTIGSFEGYHNSAPAHLKTINSGYDNPGYQRARYKKTARIQNFRNTPNGLGQLDSSMLNVTKHSKLIAKASSGSAYRLGKRLLMNRFT